MSNRSRSISVAAMMAVVLFAAGNARRVSAQNGAATRPKMTQAQMLDLQKQFEDASIAADAVKVSALMSDDAIFVHGSGAVQTKAEYINLAHHRPIKGVHLSDERRASGVLRRRRYRVRADRHRTGVAGRGTSAFVASACFNRLGCEANRLAGNSESGHPDRGSARRSGALSTFVA